MCFYELLLVSFVITLVVFFCLCIYSPKIRWMRAESWSCLRWWKTYLKLLLNVNSSAVEKQWTMICRFSSLSQKQNKTERSQIRISPTFFNLKIDLNVPTKVKQDLYQLLVVESVYKGEGAESLWSFANYNCSYKSSIGLALLNRYLVSVSKTHDLDSVSKKGSVEKPI